MSILKDGLSVDPLFTPLYAKSQVPLFLCVHMLAEFDGRKIF